MSFQCYVPRSLQHTVVGAVFVTLDGVRHLIPDHWLSRAELREKGRLLRLIYTFGTIEVAGQGWRFSLKMPQPASSASCQRRHQPLCLVCSPGSAALCPWLRMTSSGSSEGSRSDAKSDEAGCKGSGAKTQYVLAKSRICAKW
jgi:hypothetical protein